MGGSDPDDQVPDDTMPDGTAPDDRVAAAVAELYAADPDAFTDRRKALAATARSVGDGGAATAIAALRKPTRAAWVVNRLARAEPSAPRQLAELAAALRAAEEARHGPRLRELSAARGPLIDGLAARALATAGVPDPPSSLREEIIATLTAALADPEVAAAFAAGALTRAARWSGFGVADLSPADDAERASPGTRQRGTPEHGTRQRGTAERGTAERGTAERGTADPTAGRVGEPPSRSRAETGAPDDAERAEGRDSQAYAASADRAAAYAASADRAHAARSDASPHGTPADRGVSRPRRADRAEQAAARRAAEQERRAAEQERRLAREAAEREASRREKYEDMERTVALTSTAMTEAVAAEDRLEAEVRDLEQRLTKAREDLAAARMRARHAEAAEHRARQTLDRLPRPQDHLVEMLDVSVARTTETPNIYSILEAYSEH